MLDREQVEAQIERVALGDKRAFGALYDATAPKLFGVALRILNDRAEAEDALQEIYIKIWRAASAYRMNGLSPMTWLITIARNHSIDRLRARRTHGGDDELVDLIDPSPGPENQAIAANETSRIAACLAEMHAERADAIKRAYLDGDTYKVLAQRYDVPLNTIRTWLRRGLISLRACLAR